MMALVVPGWLENIVQGLGFGERVVIGLGIIVVAWYIIKALRAGKVVGSVLGRWAFIGVVVLFALGGMQLLGWLRLHPDHIAMFANDVISAVESALARWLDDLRRAIWAGGGG